MFSPSRLALARKRRGVSKAALSKATKISLRSLSYYEAAGKEPSADTVCILADALKFPESFFFADDIDEISCDGASFRSLSTMSASLRDMALASGSLAVALDKWIDQRFSLPDASSVPSLSGLDPETASQALRAEWGIGERPIANMIHLAESRGVRVFSLPVESADVDAFSIWHKRTPYIFLSPMKSGERGRMDVGHELGHLTMHGHGGPSSRQAEFEADRFAGALLMPAADVIANIPRHMSIEAIHKLKGRWKVSAIALVFRLRLLEVLSEWQYRSFCIELSKAGFRKGEAGGITRETSQIIGKVFGILRSEGVTRNAIARDLCITPSDLNGLIAGLVISSVSGIDNVAIKPQSTEPASQDFPPLRLVSKGVRQSDQG